MGMGNAHCLSLPSTLAFCFKYYGKDIGKHDGVNLAAVKVVNHNSV